MADGGATTETPRYSPAMDRTSRRRSQPADLRRDATSAAVTVVRPDPDAWSLAVLYANGDRSRLVVVDERTVLVRNTSETRRV